MPRSVEEVCAIVRAKATSEERATLLRAAARLTDNDRVALDPAFANEDDVIKFLRGEPADTSAAASSSMPKRSSSNLHTIPEDNASLLQKIDTLSAQFRALQIGRGLHALQGNTSATSLGQALLGQCPVNQLVRISDDGRAAAAAWLKRAGPAGRQFQTASLGKLGLLEKSNKPGHPTVQSLFTAVLATQPQSVRGRRTAFQVYKVHDVHEGPSVCGNLKPDSVVSVGQGDPLPSTAALVLELKRQDGAYCSPAHMLQLSKYGSELLKQLPHTFRRHILLAITDLRRIKFLRVSRTDDTEEFRYEQSEEMAEVLEALCSVLEMDPQQLQACPPPQLAYNGVPLELKKLLGAGATSTVYLSKLQSKQPVAIKVLDPGFSVSNELQVLEELAGSCVPTVVGRLDPPAIGYLLQPVGTTLATYADLVEHPLLFQALLPLVNTLRSANAKGWVHRDVRPSNLLVVPEQLGPSPVRVLLLDWGFAVKQGQEVSVMDFCGTTRFASDRLLEAFEEGRLITAACEDDLESVVKTMFALSHPVEVFDVHKVQQHDYTQLLKVWQQLFSQHPWWAALQALAAAGDYDAVAAKLTERFD